MSARLDYKQFAPEGYRAMLALNRFVESSGLEHSLMELVKIRASQINGCAYCLDMHTIDARAAGESEQRIHVLPAWREAPFYSDRERAALEWTEALTLVHETEAPDSAYEVVRKHFSEEEIVNLSLAIVAINGWNRLCVGLRAVPGTYQPREAVRRAS